MKRKDRNSRAAVYCRVSSDRQRENHTIASQRRTLPTLAEQQGYSIYRIYTDDGISGENLRNMPALRQLLDDAEGGLFSAIYIIDIDRITRFARESERALVVDICTENSISLITPDQIYTLSNRNDRLQFGVKGAVSLYEKETIRDRCRRGIAEKRRQGQWMGGTPPVGYRYNRNARILEKDPARLPAVLRILSLALTCTARETARQVNGYTPRMVRRITEQQRLTFYTGRIEIEQGEYIPAQWAPIITPAQMARIMAAKTARNARGSKSTQSTHLLTGLGIFRCGYCGRSLKAWHNRKVRKSGKIYDRAYYRCSSVHDTAGPCPNSRMVPADLIEQKILKNIENTLGNPERIRDAIQKKDAETDTPEEDKIRQAISESAARKDRLIEAIEEGILTLKDAQKRIQALNNTLLALESELKKETESAPPIDENALEILFQIDPFSAGFHETKTLISACLKKILVFQKNVFLHYAFPVMESGDNVKRLKLK